MATERLTTIEGVIKSTLEAIQEQTDSVGYTYFTKAGSVNIEDQLLAQDTGDGVDYIIYQSDGELNNEVAYGFDAIDNTIEYIIESRVENDGDVVNPKFAIRSIMNQVLSDLKHAFWMNHTLGDNVFRAKYSRSYREYNKSNNRIMAGSLFFVLAVEYSQRGSDPTATACEH